MNHFFSSRYLKLGLTIFVSGAALILFYLGASNFKGLGSIIGSISHVLSPFIYGFVMAYLMTPVYNSAVRHTYPSVRRKIKNNDRALLLSRIWATSLSLAVLFGIVGGLLSMVIPELVKSITTISYTLPGQLDSLIRWVNHYVDNASHPGASNFLVGVLPKIRDTVISWFQNDMVNTIANSMSQISQGLLGTLHTLLNVLIGMMVCVYILNGKERFKAQSCKLVYASFSEKTAAEIFNFANYVNKTFGGFINGKIIDSMIIGVICFVAMSILKLPYSLLISVIIGVTNIIPFFGPFIGAVPSTILIFMIDPLQALYFIIMIFALQQFDGNILGPKILGGTTGLASFWVMFAIIVGGGLFGFIGMVLGVPFCAVIAYYLQRRIDKKLAKKNLPTDIVTYEDYSAFQIDRKQFK